ncbi:hypothetical protein BC835DRAFT_1424476 [Cytidiella melzeri]|nr:hypothetical protein BC835DRAFT_1424476 [Cytidiella melzeri]
MNPSGYYASGKVQQGSNYTPGDYSSTAPFSPPTGSPPSYSADHGNTYNFAASPQAVRYHSPPFSGYRESEAATMYPPHTSGSTLQRPRSSDPYSDSKSQIPQQLSLGSSYQSPNRLPSGSSSLQAPHFDTANRSLSPSSGFKSKLLGSTADELLNPPPPGFTRPPPYHSLMNAPFPPCSLLSIDSTLENGFPMMPPPSSLQPHPFTIHDVVEEDWTRLLNDMKAVGRLTIVNKIVSNAAPMAIGVGFFPGNQTLSYNIVIPCPKHKTHAGIFITRAIEKGQKKKHQAVVVDLIDHWNHYFFHPRQLEVTLAQGRVVHAGTSGPPPDMPHLRPVSTNGGGHSTGDTYFHAKDRYDSNSDLSSDSNPDSRDKYRRASSVGAVEYGAAASGTQSRREAKRERSRERRERRRERSRERKQERHNQKDKRRGRKGFKNEMKAAEKEKWRLIVAFKPSTM